MISLDKTQSERPCEREVKLSEGEGKPSPSLLEEGNLVLEDIISAVFADD